MATKTVFAKSPLKSSDHVALFKTRGMALSQAEESLAYQLLSHVGYFRLSGYSIPFQRPPAPGIAPHAYIAGTSFSQVANLYRFDEALRHLCGEALQRIEVALRALVCNKLSLKHGNPHWFALPNVFLPATPLELQSGKDLVSRILRALEFDHASGMPVAGRKAGLYPYLDNYYAKHWGPAPGWMLREVGSFGLWSKIFGELADNAVRQTIANEFKYPDKKPIDETLLRGWTHTLSVFRNSCAHHHRLVYRAISFTPGTPGTATWAPMVPRNSPTVRSVLGVIALLERNTMTGSGWLARVNALLNQFDPVVNIDAALGFPGAWRNDSIWGIPP